MKTSATNADEGTVKKQYQCRMCKARGQETILQCNKLRDAVGEKSSNTMCYSPGGYRMGT